MTYQVIDGYISKMNEDRISKILSFNLPWFYNENTLHSSSTKNDKPQFVHSFCHNGEYEGSHDIFQFIKSVFPFPEWNTHRLHRCKFNLNLPLHNRKIITPHLDVQNPDSKGVIYLYYADDSDGDTRIYPGMNKLKDFKYQKYFPVKVNPKKGRLIKMSTDTWHTSDVPRKFKKRIVGNFVFLS